MKKCYTLAFFGGDVVCYIDENIVVRLGGLVVGSTVEDFIVRLAGLDVLVACLGVLKVVPVVKNALE